MSDATHDLLRALVSLSARGAFTESELLEIVAPTSRGRAKLVEAYSLCDGTRTQAEIVKALKLNQGNFSTTVNWWVRTGVMFRIRSGTQVHLLHAYSILDASPRKGA